MSPAVEQDKQSSSPSQFRHWFERSADAMTLFDPATGRFVDTNAASLAALAASRPEDLLQVSPVEISPERQPDGRSSEAATQAVVRLALERGSHRFEWKLRRFDGTESWVDVVSTAVPEGERTLLLTVSRNIDAQKRAQEEVRRLNASLEQRIAERTAELRASEERLRTLVEHAPEAIVVFDGQTGRFLDCNENAARLYGLSREALLQLSPWHVSPERQPDGQSSADRARHYLARVQAGEAPVFEWTHRHASGRLIPCEVRLVALPCEERCLVRGSVIDNTERHHRERVQHATFEVAEAALAAEDLDSFYGRVHEIIQRLMPAKNFYIALYHPATQWITFPYHRDRYTPHPAPRRVTTGLTGEVLRLGKPLRVTRDMEVKKRRVEGGVVIGGVAELPYAESGPPAAVWLGVPLLYQGAPIGVMAVQDYHNPLAYGDEQQQVLTFVAAQVALAVNRKRAEQALAQRTEDLLQHRNVLLELARLDKSDFPAAIATLCARAADATKVARVSYWSLHEQGQSLVCEHLHVRDRGGAEPAARGTRIRAGACPAYFAALARKEPLVAVHALTHDATRELGPGYLQPLGISSMLDVPVWHQCEVVGVLCQEHVGDPRDWTVEEVDFAASLATMVTLSIEAAQRHRSEQALRESEHKFRALFEASSQGVMLQDGHGYTEVNAAAASIFGRAPAEFIGKRAADLSPPRQPNGEDSAVAGRKFLEECRRTGKAQFEWTAVRADGSEVPLDVLLTRIPVGAGQTIQAMVADISGRKRAEAELKRALERERELNQLKNSFVSMVSHEFRTPLGIIQSSAEILHDYLDQLDPAERGEHLLSITRNTRRMARLMEAVLVLGRLDAGKMDFQPAPLGLPSLCRRLVEEVQAATHHQCPIRWTTTDVPETAVADERLLRHFLTNLLTNAVKYSEPGSPVTLAVAREHTTAVFVVRDCGIGIPEVEQARLFTAFQRGTNVGQRPGTGLGLVIVKRCVELHGGTIALHSRVGEGTTVTVRLPALFESL